MENGIHDLEDYRIVLKGVGRGKPRKSNLKNGAPVSIESSSTVRNLFVWIHPLFLSTIILFGCLVQNDLNAL